MLIPSKALKITRKTNLTWDLTFDADGHLDIIDGRAEWLQANFIGLIMQQGDWFFHRGWGLPWIDNPYLPAGRSHIMGSKPPLDAQLIELYVRQQLNREGRNKRVNYVEASWEDYPRRHLKVEAEIIAVDAEVLNLQLEI